MSKCNCGSNCITLLYACSGAANTGYLADMVARKLRDAQVGKMNCLAALGADLSGYIESAKSADENIVIDGCSISCGKKIFDKLDISYTQYIVTDIEGVEKSKTEITAQVIEKGFNSIKARIVEGI